MVVTKTGSWSNVEDEVLKAAISKYGLNQWARCASLIAKKTSKQCKARWNEWLDPSIKKTEWSREDDEKLLTMAKLLPTQWRTIAPIVGRTATQCLERYQKLLDDQESRESGDLGLAGPEGGESAAPTADDVRRLRPGEVDAYAESRPARPDAIDMDEEDKEMLSEARARLANVSGKKAKRKARERQLEESRRLAQLQKRRELKAAGINIKVTAKKTNNIDYNADVPLEKEVPSGFFDTTEEIDQNERQRQAFDPRKQQLANKRKADQQDDQGDSKRKKNDPKGAGGLAASYQKAAQMQKIREAEQSSKRRILVLPSPQVGEAELEDIVKMGMTGERALAGLNSDNAATQGLLGNYSGMVGSTPIRTPMAPKEEDVIANEVRNARLRTETQSALLGGDNPDLIEDERPATLSGPSRHQIVTPNPMATPFRQANGGVGATPVRQGPGATPMRTPRDSLRLNEENDMQLVGQTPRDIKLRENAMRQNIRSKLAALPKPKQSDWEFELPEEREEVQDVEMSEEDAAERDRRNQQIQQANERADFNRQSQVVQKYLPRPSLVDIDAMLRHAENEADPVMREIKTEMALLMVNDINKFGGGRVVGASRPLDQFSDDAMNNAKMELALEFSGSSAQDKQVYHTEFNTAWTTLHGSSILPGIAGYEEDEIDEHQLMVEAFDTARDRIDEVATQANDIEKKLNKHLGGYKNRGGLLRQKISDAFGELEEQRKILDCERTMLDLEQGPDGAINRRLSSLRDEVAFIARREREAQELFRARKEELEGLQEPVNGVH